MNVGDKIRNMSDEELLNFLTEDNNFVYTRCKICKYSNGCHMDKKECIEGVKYGLTKEI